MPPPAPVSSPAPIVFAHPSISMSRTATAKKKSPNPATSTSGARTYDSYPSSGEKTPQLPGSTKLEDAMDIELPDSEDEQPITSMNAGRGDDPDSEQAPPLRLPEAWTSLLA